MVNIRRAGGQAVRVFLAAGIWMSGNLLTYKLYLALPFRLPPALNVFVLWFPLVPAALAQAWTYFDVQATGKVRMALTLFALLAHALFWGHFLAFSWTF